MMVIAVKEDLDQRLEQFFANKHQFWRLWDKGRPSLFFDKKMNKVILKQYVYRNEEHLGSESEMNACLSEKSTNVACNVTCLH